MKPKPFFRLLPLLAIASAAADSFELKDGTKLEGSILREEGSDYIVQVQVTKSIKDERRIPKSDVIARIAEKKDETAFEKIARLAPTPDLLSEALYAARIRQIEDFVKKFPDSTKKAAALKIREELESELTEIKAGGVKFKERIIPAAERAPQAYSLDASIALSGIKAAVDAGDVLSALRAWTRFETDFTGSSAHRENIGFMTRVMKQHLANVVSTLAQVDARNQARNTSLDSMIGSERSRSQQAIQEEQDTYLARVEREKTAGIKWLSLDPYVKAPLEETRRLLENEIRRLESIDLSKLPDTEKIFTDTYAIVTRQEVTRQEADAAISKARSANLSASYLEQLSKLAPEAP